MLVLYPASAVVSSVVSSCFICELILKVRKISFFKEYTLVCLLWIPRSKTPPCLWNSNRKYPPMPSDFQFKEPPLALGIPKGRPWYGMDIFWNRLMVSTTMLLCSVIAIYYNRIATITCIGNVLILRKSVRQYCKISMFCFHVAIGNACIPIHSQSHL